MKIKIKKIRNTAIVPEFKTEGAVAMDFHASLDGMKQGTRGLGDREYVLLPRASMPIPLGIAVQLEPGYEMRIRPRSSILLQGVTIATLDAFDDEGFAGTIDSDYRGELHAILHNLSDKPFVIADGQRICQGVISRVECLANGLEMELVDELDPTERGEKRFGHTGK